MNSYERYFTSAIQAGLSPTDAAVRVFETYLDGKPRLRGAVKGSLAELDVMLWQQEYLYALPAEAWQTQAAILSLTRYMHSTQLSNLRLLEHLAILAPGSLRSAIRYSGIALQHNPLRLGEITHLAMLAPQEFAEIARILAILENAHRQRINLVEECRAAIVGLSPLEMLMYASLYAYEYIVPEQLSTISGERTNAIDTQHTWEAINNLLIWKLATADAGACVVSESDIVNSLRLHLIPFINPSSVEPVREDIYRAFCALLIKQMELDSFIDRTVDAFCYNDTIRFVLQGNDLKIVETDQIGKKIWQRNGERLACLHQYWYYRAMDRFFESGMAVKSLGTPENHDANSVAWMKALRTWLQLDEVYGMNATVVADSGLPVDLFQALLALELMTQYFNIAFMQPYLEYYRSSRDSRSALRELMLSGLQQPGMNNLMPVTWSDRQTRIAKIIGWTVSAEFPDGSSEAAEAILDFWTSDWALLAKRLRAGTAGLHPELFERPVIRMGSRLFQLPWLVAEQNNASAAINNLRRLGARRTQAREETHRIETRLAHYLATRGLKTVTNYMPPRIGGKAAGEVDIICAAEGQVIVMEVKSTFLRRSIKDAWRHMSSTLRKAGLQLQRKIEATRLAVKSDVELREALGLSEMTDVVVIHGWIVDTSIEYDHERFNGFLKISLEELVIALRDDAHYLRNSGGLFPAGQQPVSSAKTEPGLYPEGFSVARLVEVIETELVWRGTSGQS
ncbi:MAG: hypothetical protein V4628_08895 [Pseudomonadota bacterium]